MMFNGLTIVPSVFAREVRDEWAVVRNPIKKRRRNWRVVKRHIDRPGAFQAGSVVYMHPELVEKLKASLFAGCVDCHRDIDQGGKLSKTERRALEAELNLKTLRALVESGKLRIA